MFRDGETKMTVTLQPRDLGKVIVELVREEQSLSAALRVDTPETKELLESSIAALRSTLDGQGIKVEEFTVSLNREDLPTSEHRGEGGSQKEIVAGDSGREETRFDSLTEQPLAADQPRLFGYNTMELIA
jgi:flagellar hook-length control protein FliK